MTDPFRSRVTPYHNIAYRVVGDTERAVSSTDAASPPATAMNPSSNKDRLTLTRWFEFQFIETTTATTTTIANGGNRNPNSRFIQADWSESSKLSLLLELFQAVQRPSNLISMTRIQRLNHGLIQLDLRWNPRRNCGCLEINAIESPSTASVAKTQSQIIMTNSLYGFMDCSKSNPRRRNGLFQLRSHGSILNHWNKQTNKKKEQGGNKTKMTHWGWIATALPRNLSLPTGPLLPEIATRSNTRKLGDSMEDTAHLGENPSNIFIKMKEENINKPQSLGFFFFYQSDLRSTADTWNDDNTRLVQNNQTHSDILTDTLTRAQRDVFKRPSRCRFCNRCHACSYCCTSACGRGGAGVAFSDVEAGGWTWPAVARFCASGAAACRVSSTWSPCGRSRSKGRTWHPPPATWRSSAWRFPSTAGSLDGSGCPSSATNHDWSTRTCTSTHFHFSIIDQEIKHQTNNRLIDSSTQTDGASHHTSVVSITTVNSSHWLNLWIK